MVLVNLNQNKRSKFCCGFVVSLTTLSLFVWNIALDDEQKERSVNWLGMKKSNNKSSSILGRLLIQNLKSSRDEAYSDDKKTGSLPGKVLIVSRGRSGSTFLGELFNQNKEVLYLFEPLTWSRAAPSNYEQETYEVIDDLYKCKFANKMYLNYMISRKFYRDYTAKLSTFPGQCSRMSRSAGICLRNIMKSICLGSKTVVAKVLTHRLPQGGLKGIKGILDEHKDLKIVHLLRDPRRVISSMKKAGWFKGKIFDEQVKKVCSSMWENVKHVQNESIYYKNRYKLLVFADMMANPNATVVELYDFLKMGPVPGYLFTWITENTLGFDKPSKLQSTYKTSRNSTEVLTRKVNFTTTEEISINTYCSDVIKFVDSVRISGS